MHHHVTWTKPLGKIPVRWPILPDIHSSETVVKSTIVSPTRKQRSPAAGSPSKSYKATAFNPPRPAAWWETLSDNWELGRAELFDGDGGVSSTKTPTSDVLEDEITIGTKRLMHVTNRSTRNWKKRKVRIQKKTEDYLRWKQIDFSTPIPGFGSRFLSGNGARCRLSFHELPLRDAPWATMPKSPVYPHPRIKGLDFSWNFNILRKQHYLISNYLNILRI